MLGCEILSHIKAMNSRINENPYRTTAKEKKINELISIIFISFNSVNKENNNQSK